MTPGDPKSKNIERQGEQKLALGTKGEPMPTKSEAKGTTRRMLHDVIILVPFFNFFSYES